MSSYYQPDKMCPFEVWLSKVAVARIRQTLARTGGDREATARQLGMERTMLFRYLDLGRHYDDQAMGNATDSNGNRYADLPEQGAELVVVSGKRVLVS